MIFSGVDADRSNFGLPNSIMTHNIADVPGTYVIYNSTKTDINQSQVLQGGQ